MKCPWFNENKGCVASAADCPDIGDLTAGVPLRFACPNFWNSRCRDGSCRVDLALCEELQCPFHLPHRCADGLCVDRVERCNSAATGCPWHRPVRCRFNGQCMASEQLCASAFARNCSNPLAARCPSGSCDPSGLASECPAATTCYPGETVSNRGRRNAHAHQ